MLHHKCDLGWISTGPRYPGEGMASTPSFGFLRAPDSSPYKVRGPGHILPSGHPALGGTYCQLWSPSSPSTLPGLSFLGCPRPATGTLSPSQARSIAVIPRLPHFQLPRLVYHKVHDPSPALIQIFGWKGLCPSGLCLSHESITG